MKLLSLLLVALLLSSPLAAEKAAEVNLTLHVDAFHLVRIAPDRAEAEIDLSVTADMDGRIERIDFSNIHANGVPFFAQPLDTALDVHRGQSLSLPPLAVTVYTGDLDSLDPLIAILDEGQTRLQAELTVRVQATPLEHLLLRDAHPVAILEIDQDVEVQPPGGLLGRVSATAILKSAQIAMAGAAHLPVRLSFSDPAWRTQMSIAQTALLHARACYALTKKNSNEECIDQLAFALGPQEAISTAELGTPWRFDPRRARAFADQGGHLQASDPRITLEPLGIVASAATPATFQQSGDIATMKVILLPSRSRLSLVDRNSPGLYGHLRTATTGSNTPFQLAPAQGDTDRLAIFRLVHTPDGAWIPRVLYLSGSLTGQTITFSRPIDRAAIGSPILTPQGVIGVVQSETGGTLVTGSLLH